MLGEKGQRWHVVVSPRGLGHIRAQTRGRWEDRTLCGIRARGQGWHYLLGNPNAALVSCRSCAKRLP